MFSMRYLKVWVGGAILLVLCICGIAAPLLAPRDPQAQTLEDRLRPPRWAENGSSAYLLGTDNLGRDMLSRIIYGSRISLIVGAATVIFAGLLGCTLGAIAGYFGRTPDEIVSKISEIFLAFPFLLIAIAIMAFLGQGVGNLIMALMLSRWVQYCRVVRGEVLSIRERDFVTAAKALGGKDWYVLFRHVVPNTFASVTVIATFGMAIVIITEASLSFLGLGVPVHIPT
ncbi:MAG TPA: ABC transporter permease, partial [Candidatus Binatia bacterium]|nr:ABC transporter permease [Candidatus Binatia bacterium]